MSQFSKERLDSLMQNVIFTIQDQLQENDNFKKVALDSDKNLHLNLLFTKFSLSLVDAIKEEPIEIFEKILDFLDELDIDSNEIKNLFLSYFEYLYNWLCSCNYDIDLFESTIKSFETIVEDNTGIKLELVDENGMLIFRSTIEDENINREHFVKTDKISAKEFMQDNYMNDDEFKASIRETIKRFESIDSFTVTLTNDYIKSVLDILNKLLIVFGYGHEFKELRVALEIFSNKIKKYDVDSLSNKQKILLKEFISNVMEDLIDWNKRVIFEQTAIDIHYLDASINANISQFDMVLESV